jgi:hypothetical protein
MITTPPTLTATEKHPSIDAFLEKLVGGNNRVASITTRKCVACSGPASEFKDLLSIREYSISGLCQACQDKVFDAPNNEENE